MMPQQKTKKPVKASTNKKVQANNGFIKNNRIFVAIIAVVGIGIIGALALFSSHAATMPDASNTGMPSGTVLRALSQAYPDKTAKGYSVDSRGKVTISKSGTAANPNVFDKVYFPHGVKVTARFVIIKNSKLSSGRSSFGYAANPKTYAECKSFSGGNATLFISRSSDTLPEGASSLIVENSEIRVRKDGNLDGISSDLVNGQYLTYNNDGPSVGVNTVQGRNVTLRSVNISGGVDGVDVNGSQFVIENSYIHDMFKWPLSPGHGCDEPTHSDGIQIHGSGSDVKIRGNNITPNPLPITVSYKDAKGVSKTFTSPINSNSGIQTNGGSSAKLDIQYNFFKYGVCQINFGDSSNTANVSNNIYNGGGGQSGTDAKYCAVTSTFNKYTFSNNKWWDGAIVKPGFNKN